MGIKRKHSKKFTALILIATVLFSIIPAGIGLAVDAPDIPPQDIGKYQGTVDEKPDATALTSDKEDMTEAEQKMSSSILKLANSDFLSEDVSQADVLDQVQEFGYTGAANEVYVYIEVSGGDFDALKPYVSSIENSDADKGMAAAWVNIASLGKIAALDDVINIREVVAPIVYEGSELTEGDAIHNADDVRSTFGVDGSGIKIGILSDGVDNLSSAVSSGDLPGDVTVLSNAFGGDEGTAMLEIVYDMAPGADLYFHDCGSTVLDFCDGIDDLVSAGCDVICDDIGWLLEPYFEDGTVASHIDSVLSSTDIVYTSSAGNGASSHHQSLFCDNGSSFHDCDLYAHIPIGGAIQVIMQWNEPFGSAASDYDLVLYDMTHNSIVAEANDGQDGDDDPLERLIYVNDTGVQIDVAIWVYAYNAPVDKIIEINMYSYGGYNYTDNITAADSIFGHPAVPDVIACGAIDQADSGHDDIESFSSCGPVTMLGSTRNKPDVCGIDGVSVTGAGGFPSTFYGTSAAAPHIAAVAALLRSQNPSMDASEIRSLIVYNAVDLGSAGYDNTFGYGRCDALAAANASGTSQYVKYCTHVQNVGWQDWKYNGETAGTSGQSLRLEGICIEILGESNAIEYRTHVQNIGWQDWVSDGEMAGTSGLSYRLEAIDIRLTGTMAEQCDVYYRVHAQNIGWMDWAKNGASAGTAGYAYRLEAIEIVLVEKGGAAPGPTTTPFRENTAPPDPVTDDSVKYKTHVQNVGWQDWKRNGETAGTSGQSLRLEGIYIEIDGKSNAIEYRTHVQNIGWQDWKSDGEMSGTSGLAYRLEAIDIRLTGDMATQYDIYYRVHAQNFGWMGWAKNGASAGTAGYAYRLEAIEIVLVEKGGSAPGSTTTPFESA